MMLRRIRILTLIFLLLLAGCGRSDDNGDGEVNGEGKPFRIAIIMPSSTTDIAWSQSMFDSLIAVQAEMGGEDALKIAYSEGMFRVTDASAAIRDYASEGFDLVIAHGAQYGNSVFEVATDFTETSFAWGTSSDTGADKGIENVFAYGAVANEGGYVNGVVAAMLSQNDVIGVIGPVAGDAKLYIDGFVKGVNDVKPHAQVNISYTGSFSDTTLAAEAAHVHIQAGADVLTGSAQQVVGAIGVASENDVAWLGTQSDQISLGPDVVVTNQIYNWANVVTDMISKIEKGELGGTAYSLTFANDGLRLEFNENIEIADEVKAAARTAIEDIKSGDVDPVLIEEDK
ncbi:MAG: BMP family ABC transporter substrate-binding protein [Caldilineaceae bacterium SB0670_bin_27]|uniref:BMP family ABC transporter substrate-binding protein n=1 Tax=Caldilineaceae bacterium SB0664_bin_27 TaxID=2605260 RepID=A0A6B0YXF7_9CHLR|nr:BMP family ABC transporter substrate-binding protein [Caldilineaceae bacterium SB0664_bin_27]MYJ77931.1 BMP family ABC transporter substrate-binding protein [Caldilineaceae bacterium SB0670_bin_27]